MPLSQNSNTPDSGDSVGGGEAAQPSGAVETSDPAHHPESEAKPGGGDDYLQMLGSIALELDSVEDALRRLDEAGAGRCDVCGAEIGVERLAGDPLLTRCAVHPD